MVFFLRTKAAQRVVIEARGGESHGQVEEAVGHDGRQAHQQVHAKTLHVWSQQGGEASAYHVRADD